MWDAHYCSVGLGRSDARLPALWTVTGTTPPCPTVNVDPPSRRDRAWRAMAYQVPSRFGFHVVERWQFSFAQVTKSIP